MEVDQSFLGGTSAGRPGSASDKVPIMIAAERDHQERLARVRLEVADAPGTLEQVDFARQVVEPGSTIRTDGARMFCRLADDYIHEATTGYNAVDKTAAMPGAHLVSSLLKR